MIGGRGWLKLYPQRKEDGRKGVAEALPSVERGVEERAG